MNCQDINDALNPSRIRAWCENFLPGAVVGVAEETCECPLARYLKSLGYEIVDVQATIVKVEDTECELPAHAQKIVREVDSIPDTRRTQYMMSPDRDNDFDYDGDDLEDVNNIFREELLGILDVI